MKPKALVIIPVSQAGYEFSAKFPEGCEIKHLSDKEYELFVDRMSDKKGKVFVQKPREIRDAEIARAKEAALDEETIEFISTEGC